MNTFQVTPTGVMAAVGVLLVVLWLWRASVRRARAAADAARASARLLSLTGRVLLGAALIAGVQWLAFTHPASSWLVKLVALGVPALFGAFTLVRALTVTTVDGPRRRGGGRR